MSKNIPTELPDENRGELLLYQVEGDGPRLEVRLHDESVWLSLNQMAELFQVDKSGISRHLKNVFESGELQREATVANFATVEFLSSSPSSKIFLICLDIVDLSL